MSTTYLIKNVSVLGGTPTDLLLKDGLIVSPVDGDRVASASERIEISASAVPTPVPAYVGPRGSVSPCPDTG